MSDLKPLVKKAFDRGFIDNHVLGFDHFEEDLRRGIEHPGEPRLPVDRDCTLFGHAVEELSGWYCFSEQYREDQERYRRQTEANRARSQRLENPFKGVGRNDPCPCGSGKKFKKCCLGAMGVGSIGPEVGCSNRSDISISAAEHKDGSDSLVLAKEQTAGAFGVTLTRHRPKEPSDKSIFNIIRT